jgi:hypothetical protein
MSKKATTDDLWIVHLARTRRVLAGLPDRPTRGELAALGDGSTPMSESRRKELLQLIESGPAESACDRFRRFKATTLTRWSGPGAWPPGEFPGDLEALRYLADGVVAYNDAEWSEDVRRAAALVSSDLSAPRLRAGADGDDAVEQDYYRDEAYRWYRARAYELHLQRAQSIGELDAIANQAEARWVAEAEARRVAESDARAVAELQRRYRSLSSPTGRPPKTRSRVDGWNPFPRRSKTESSYLLLSIEIWRDARATANHPTGRGTPAEAAAWWLFAQAETQRSKHQQPFRYDVRHGVPLLKAARRHLKKELGNLESNLGKQRARARLVSEI